MKAIAMEQRPTASEAVLDAVAARRGVDPLDLETPLYEAIDPDELDALVSRAQKPGGSPVEIRFEYDGYSVTVDSELSVTISE